MRSQEALKLSNVAAGTHALGTLSGGKYAISYVGTGTPGTAGLQMLLPDGSTYIAVHTAFAATTGFVVVDLPPGLYQVVIVTFTANYFSVVRIPGE